MTTPAHQPAAPGQSVARGAPTQAGEATAAGSATPELEHLNYCAEGDVIH